MASIGRSRVERDLEERPVQAGEHVVRSVPGGDDERSRCPFVDIRNHPDLATATRGEAGGHALHDAHAAFGQRPLQSGRDGGQVHHAAVEIDVADVSLEVREARAQCLSGERCGRDTQVLENTMAEVPVCAREVRRHRTLRDVHAAAADQHRRARLCLEVVPQPQGFTREPRIAGIEVIAAVGPRAAERGGHRIPDPTALEHHNPLDALGCVVRREQTHHPAADDHQVLGHTAGHSRRRGSAARTPATHLGRATEIRRGDSFSMRNWIAW